MNADLSALLRSVAREETAAAGREFPLSSDVVSGYARSAGRRRAVVVTSLAAGTVVVTGGIALGATQWWRGADAPIAATPSPSVPASESASPSPSPTASVGPSASPSPTPSASPASSANSAPSATAAETPAPPAVELPPQVTVVSASTGGGSGEVLVHWDAVDGATGYRVYRASSADGEYSRAASISVSTGATSVEYGGSYESIQIWQPSPASFEYVEAVDGARAYFRVAAFNDAGRGPKSTVVCGAPPGAADGC